MSRTVRAACALLLGAIAPISQAEAGPLDPSSYQSLGTLSLTSGVYTINSSAGSPTLVVGGTTFHGVVSNGVAVFDFDSVTIASGATLAGSGGLPIALLSRSFETINGTINVSAFGSQAGPGAGGGNPGGSGQSLYNGNQLVAFSGSGGGGFGGAGGNGGAAAGLPGGMGGAASANLANKLEGGASSSGGGGGAIELGAVGNISIGGEVDALGGNSFNAGGGGGSGGGIFLHGAVVTLTGSLNAPGGTGGFGFFSTAGSAPGGGGGGGGEIVVQFSQGYQPLGVRNVAGGLGATGYSGLGSSNGISGSAGQVLASFVSPAVAVPEPSSLALLGTSAFGLLGYTLARRRAARRPGA